VRRLQRMSKGSAGDGAAVLRISEGKAHPAMDLEMAAGSFGR